MKYANIFIIAVVIIGAASIILLGLSISQDLSGVSFSWEKANRISSKIFASLSNIFFGTEIPADTKEEPEQQEEKLEQQEEEKQELPKKEQQKEKPSYNPPSTPSPKTPSSDYRPPGYYYSPKDDQKTKQKAPTERTSTTEKSPYFGKVRISQVISETSQHPSLITLETNYYIREEKINITGWYLEAKEGTITVPQTLEKYDPAIEVKEGKSLNYEDLFLERGGRVEIANDEPPKSTLESFRLNKCFGYLNNYYDFTLQIPQNCPKPKREEVLDLKPCCQSYVYYINRCEIPKYWQESVIHRDSECTSLITDYFNYPGCLERYSEDNDFFENEWHIYTSKNILGKGLDILYLRDQNGFIVDEYSYGTLCCE